MTRQTSIAAYRKLVESGRLARSQRAVYRALYEAGPMTRNELDARLAPGRPNPPHSRRLVELERMGLVRRVDVRPCTVTGDSADAWDVTALEEPRKVPRRVPELPLLRSKLATIRSLLERGDVFPDGTLAAIRRVVDDAPEAAR